MSVQHRFIFLGLPGSHSVGLEDWMRCRFGALAVDEAWLLNAIKSQSPAPTYGGEGGREGGGEGSGDGDGESASGADATADATANTTQQHVLYADFSVVKVQFDPLSRSIGNYGAAIALVRDRLFVSEARTFFPSETVGLPLFKHEREEALEDASHGSSRERGKAGTVAGLYAYLQDAARSHTIGCDGRWWAEGGRMSNVEELAALVASEQRNQRIAPEGTQFTFRPGTENFADDVAAFEKAVLAQPFETFRAAEEARNAFAATCLPDSYLPPISAASASRPEVLSFDLLATLQSPSAKEDRIKVDRLICAMNWQELVCADAMPKACAVNAPRFDSEGHPERRALNSSAYSWLADVIDEFGRDKIMNDIAGHPREDDEPDRAGDYNADDEEMEARVCAKLSELRTVGQNGERLALRQEPLKVGIITVDLRATSSPIHVGVKTWQAYAEAHGYEYIPLDPGGFLRNASRDEQDWVVSTKMLEVMSTPKYSHLQLFAYTELEQWIVRPTQRLDHIFHTAGLHRCHGPIMVLKSIPELNSIDTSAFLFRRSPKMRNLLLEWKNETFGVDNSSGTPVMSRQHAFIHNFGVYSRFKDDIVLFKHLPFRRSDHVTHGGLQSDDTIVNSTHVFQTIIQPCIIGALISGNDYICALNPPMYGAECEKCSRHMQLRLPNGTYTHFIAEQCCDEEHAALPVQKYKELSAIFEATVPKNILDNLVDVYEGRAPMSSYHSRLHHLLPELSGPIPERWRVEEPATQPLEPLLRQRLDTETHLHAKPPPCELSGTCTAPEGCWEQMQAVGKLPTLEENQWHDYKHCLTPGNGGSASPVNSYCAAASCSALAGLMKTDTTRLDGSIAILVIDSRKIHPALATWQAYCDLHKYEFIHSVVTATPEELAQVDDHNMLYDWRSTKQIMNVMNSPEYAHVNYFMYTELDQWIVTPYKTRLEPLIVAHGLDTGDNIMAVVEEYPCRDVRGGGVFNMGTFLLRRSNGALDLLNAWYGSHMHGGEFHAAWPARQGAFSHDPSVYNAFRDSISVIPSACPLGSPYGLALAHVTGGDVIGAFIVDPGRDVFETLVLPCVKDALDAGVEHTCALHPPWAGGTCLTCKQKYQFVRNGTNYDFEAETCCGENDAALLTHKFHELAGLFEARDPDRIVEALKAVYEGRAPVEAYALVGIQAPMAAEEEWAVDHEFSDHLAATIDDVLAKDNTSFPFPPPVPPPEAPPPLPGMCDTAGCVQPATWEGPRSLVYVAHTSTAENPVFEVYRHLHLQTGMPYAWGGKHAGWLADAQRRGFRCEAYPLDTKSATASSPTQCLCFLEYLFKYNLTAEGLWLCPDSISPRYNNMLQHVMPDAKWFSTVRDPWTHMVAAYESLQASQIDLSMAQMTVDNCSYAGDGFRGRLSSECFPALFADPVLRHCLVDDTSLLFSQMCALGFSKTPSAPGLEANYDLLTTAENPVTPLLAALHLEWNVSLAVIQRVQTGLEMDCATGNTFGIESLGYSQPTHWNGNVTRTQYTDYTSWSSDMYELYQHSARRATELTEQYQGVVPKAGAPCWDRLFPNASKPVAETYKRPVNETTRWTAFDNSNWRFEDMRVDQCMAGMPESVNVVSLMDAAAPASTRAAANGLLHAWTTIARELSPHCFNCTGYEADLSRAHNADAIVAPKYKLAFQTVAKVGSMTATYWMQCRFGGAYNVPSLPDYTRVFMMREPTSRSFAGFLQMSSHYLGLFRLPPSNISLCADAWPEGLDDIVHDPTIFDANSTWPAICREAWTLTLNHQEQESKMKTKIQLTKENLLATKNSSLYNALWALPPGCRQIGRTLWESTNETTGEKEEGTTWFCEGSHCRDECQLTEYELATLFAKGLSDAARQFQLGCDSQSFGNEHMWPQVMHTHRAGRADAIIRLEHADEDEPRFDELLSKRLGHKIPPAPPNCTLSTMHRGGQDTLVEPAINNASAFKSIVARSPTLQRRICALYYHDFVCGGYELPPACKQPTGLWLASTIRDLMLDAPVPPLDVCDVGDLSCVITP